MEAMITWHFSRFILTCLTTHKSFHLLLHTLILTHLTPPLRQAALRCWWPRWWPIWPIGRQERRRSPWSHSPRLWGWYGPSACLLLMSHSVVFHLWAHYFLVSLRFLLQLPTIIADNAGYDSADLVAQLRAAHQENKTTFGLSEWTQHIQQSNISWSSSGLNISLKIQDDLPTSQCFITISELNEISPFW